MSVYTQEGSVRHWANFPVARAWMDRHSIQEQSQWFKNNKKQFLKYWGRQTCTFTSEYRHWVWQFFINVDKRALPYYVLTGNKGTSVEIHKDMPEREIREIMGSILAIAKKEI